MLSLGFVYTDMARQILDRLRCAICNGNAELGLTSGSGDQTPCGLHVLTLNHLNHKL
jgi:hypothetical protein